LPLLALATVALRWSICTPSRLPINEPKRSHLFFGTLDVEAQFSP
jgi:hypothetical protein